MTVENIIEFRDVKYSYDGEEGRQGALVIDRLNLKIQKGEFVAVLGHNGSGKSTVAKLCNAILQPESGKVLVNGMDTSDEDLKYEIRQSVGMVFQNPDNQIVASIVEEDVAFGPENLGIPPKEIRTRVDNALKTVGMYDYRKHETHKLSGGQKQRVAIAGIIAMTPECIVLDEPTAMLDPKGRAEVMKTIRHLNHDMGITILFITHYMDEAVQADRVLVIDEGRVIMDGRPREVFANVQMLKSVGLDVPQATELCHELRGEGLDLPRDVLNVEECILALSRLLEAERQ